MLQRAAGRMFHMWGEVCTGRGWVTTQPDAPEGCRTHVPHVGRGMYRERVGDYTT